ncbi:MAG: stalk domain-containing protein [Tissierellaceae bacterium]|nr:stalk domain-containing protein [Tissierellaceae bacterium]
MKRSSKLALILALLLVFPTVGFGEEVVDETSDVDELIVVEEEEVEDEEEVEEVEVEEEKEEVNGKGNEKGNEKGKAKGNAKDKSKPWKEDKAAVKLEKDELEALKDEVESEIDEFEKQLEAAKVTGDEATITALKEQLEILKTEKDEYKTQFKAKIAEMQKIVKEKYTKEEITELEDVAKTLQSLENVSVISIENVLIGKGKAKFDTPPVIKEGRTLIPVRAISEAMGADVAWNAEEKTVTITKDDKVIVFNLTENKVYVDEAEVTIDVPAEVMNNRTMVPLRFIAEQLGLVVEYDEEMQTIVIE